MVPLLEREHPLDVLIERARRAGTGQGSVVLVAGDAGIGKTVLLRAFVGHVREQAQPLWGMCDSLSTPVRSAHCATSCGSSPAGSRRCRSCWCCPTATRWASTTR